MTITVTIIETNNRSAGFANGYRVDGLAPLTGSAKQVAWAETIRAKAASTVAQLLAHKKGLVDKSGFFPAADYDAICAALSSSADATIGKAPTDAAWWIDNRSAGIDGITWAHAIAKTLR